MQAQINVPWTAPDFNDEDRRAIADVINSGWMSI
jgi:hypothetical protein